MAGSRAIPLFAMAAVLFSLVFTIGSEGSPRTVQSNISIFDTEIVIRENETTEVQVDGSFMIESVGAGDTIGGLSATLTISEATWAPTLSQTFWDNVQQEQDYFFTVDFTIPEDTGVGDSSNPTLYLDFENPIKGDVGSSSRGFEVKVISVIDSGRNDDDDDSGIISPAEDESFPLWPIFIIVIVIGLVIAGIWVRKNIDFVREEDGSRRIMMREKDTGRILGRKKQPPPEIEL